MKQKYDINQYIQLAKQNVLELFNDIPTVNDVEIFIRDTSSFDFDVDVFYKDENCEHLCIEVKSRGEKRFALQFIERINCIDRKNCIFIAPYVSDETARVLKENEIGYIDLSGNCYIVTDRLFIEKTGNKNKYIENRKQKDIFSKKSVCASKIIRTMLEDYSKSWQIKELVNLTNTSLGSVSNAKNALLEKGYIEELDLGFKLVDVEGLLREWAKSYSETKYISYQYYSLDNISDVENKVYKMNTELGTNVLLGSFGSAVRYSPTVRYNKLVLYARDSELFDLVKYLNLKSVDKGGNISIIVPSDENPFLYYKTINNSDVTSPVQTILDLLSSESRGEEAAEAIIKKEYK